MAACARQGIPPGGPDDQRPPVVVRTTPTGLAEVTEPISSIRFEFDERISERSSGGVLDQAVTISPRGGQVRVKHSRRALTVTVEEGFRPGIVYRATLQPVISDMFGNTMTDPFELVFSTGGEAVANTLAGEIWDRVDGRGVADARILATDANGLIHQSVASREGIFAFRYLPAGAFDVQAFVDTNRNDSVDMNEAQGRTTTSLAVGDTVLLDFGILEPDTTAAVTAGTSIVDSVTIAVEFDDYLDPTEALDVGQVVVTREGGSAPVVVDVYHEAAYAAFVEEVSDSLARLDSIDAAAYAAESAAAAAAQAAAAEVAALAGDSIAGDSVAASTPPDTVVVGAPAPGDPPAETRPTRVPPTRLSPLQGSRPGPTADGRRVLPGRRIVVVVSDALAIDAEYRIDVSGIRNLNGLADGGGPVTVMREAAPVDTTTIDSLGIDPATLDSLIDTAGVVDTIGVSDASGPGDTPAVFRR